MEQVNDISALMKELNLKNWRDLDTSEEDSKKLRATFSEVGYGFFLLVLIPIVFKILSSPSFLLKQSFPTFFKSLLRRIFAF